MTTNGDLMGWRDVLRNLIDSDEPDEIDDTGAIDEIERGVEEVIGEGDDTEEPDEGSDPGEGNDEIDGTPGDEEEPPEVAELRQQILDQAAEIETLRNRLAAAGLEDEVTVEEAVEDDVDNTTEEDAIEAFDNDYAKREAILAEIKKGH